MHSKATYKRRIWLTALLAVVLVPVCVAWGNRTASHKPAVIHTNERAVAQAPAPQHAGFEFPSVLLLN